MRRPGQHGAHTVDVSVLLVSWNTREETRSCLDALAATAGPVRYEVIAVDNGSRDGSAELLAGYPPGARGEPAAGAAERVAPLPGVRLVRNPRNVGFAAAVNQAYRLATGRLVLLLNSDVRFPPGTLAAMVEFLRERPDAAGVSPLYLNEDGTFQQHYVQLPSFAAMLALVTALRRLPGFRRALHRFQMRGEDFTRPRRLASGSCMLVRREALGDGPIFDERFPIYWNDAILARRLAAAGHELWMIPYAAVTHTRGASCRLLGPAIRFRHLLGSLVRYAQVTGPAYRLPILRAVVLADHLVKRLLGRPVPLSLSDLRAALRGDGGPLPDGDIRDWLIHVSPTRWSAGGPPTELAAQVAAGRRVLFVEPPGRWPRRRLVVEPVGAAMWRVTPPVLAPYGGRVPVLDRVNRRIGATRLRQWLDGHAGARILHVADERGGCAVGRLVEDEVVAALGPVREFAGV